MNVLKTPQVKSGRATLRITYHADGSKTETKNPKGSPPVKNGAGHIIIKNVPDEFRGVTAGRYSAAPGVSFEQAMHE